MGGDETAVYNWDKIEREYIRGKASYAELAKKHKINPKHLAKVGKEREFARKRREYRQKVGEEALARAGTRDAEQAARLISGLLSGMEEAARRLNEGLQSQDALYNWTWVDKDAGMCEKRLRKMDTGALRDLAGALRSLSGAMGALCRKEEKAEAQEETPAIILMQTLPVEEKRDG